ncbi:MAG: glycoside hydrolase family 26 protein [Gemmatimonadaceae bacterium]
MSARRIARLAAALLAAGACAGRTDPTLAGASAAALAAADPMDSRATSETRALFHNLRALARTGVMFGHQDDLAYGVTWSAEPGRSDVKETAGSYPAVYGWDVSGLERESGANIDGVEFARLRAWILEGYRRGGVITVSWHMDNPVSGGNAWDTTRAVAAILPGGARHAEYRRWLDRFGAFARSLRGPGRTGDTTLVPVVFRPFHENSGGWFWWGRGRATPEEYRALWRYSVHYVRDTLGVHNLLWAYSPNGTGDSTRARVVETYPGDEYVDVIGLDQYFQPPRAGAPDPAEALARLLRVTVEEAEARGKIPALTETGLETVPDSLWWTGTLRRAIAADPVGRRIAWALVWRNANRARERRLHFYAPYPGHPSAADFRRFRDDPLVLFEDELPDLYKP